MKTEIIAEAGVNHNGSLSMALELVDAAAAAGASVVKFQTFKPEKVISRHARKAEYQKSTTDSAESQLDMVRKLELSEEAHLTIRRRCFERGITFLSTPFDHASVDLLVEKIKVDRLKVPSGEITNAPLLVKMGRCKKPLLVSTGMATLGEIEGALGALAFGLLNPSRDPESAVDFAKAFISEDGQQILRSKVTLMHCTTEYPAPFDEANLKAIQTLAQAFGLPVGFSDHTPGINIPLASVALGAVVVEKHFTLDRNLPGPDHKASLLPSELRAMIDGIRQVEAALGNGRKLPSRSELKNIGIARKSLVATKAIRKGEPFTKTNLDVKRPGTGVTPFAYWRYLGKLSDRDYEPDEEIKS